MSRELSPEALSAVTGILQRYKNIVMLIDEMDKIIEENEALLGSGFDFDWTLTGVNTIDAMDKTIARAVTSIITMDACEASFGQQVSDNNR